MSEAPCLVGQKFGRLLVTSEAGYVRGRSALNCVCDCGKQVVVQSLNVKNGNTRSCGCSRKGMPHPWKVTHGMSRTKTWKVWAGMRERCLNPHARHFNHYGGRGISFCDRWNSFENFLADMGERPTGMSLDRINVNGNYEPGNCRWATSVEQARNKRNSCVLTGFGETKTASEWIHDPRRAASISPGAVRTRITKGWTVESALTIEKIVGRRAPSALITYSKAVAA